jgi:hypothetical protein
MREACLFLLQCGRVKDELEGWSAGAGLETLHGLLQNSRGDLSESMLIKRTT